VCAGPRDTEAALLEWVRARRAGSLAELDQKLRIIVPSRSLRHHLLAVLAREFGALAGLVVQTHRALAREVLEYGGAEPPVGLPEGRELLLRQLASREEVFAATLGKLRDGYAPVVAALQDLLDAGLDASNIEVLRDAVTETGPGPGRQRAFALLRTAGRWLHFVGSQAPARRIGVLEAAVEMLENGVFPPSRGILIHGFAEATGLVSNLLEALCRRYEAECLFDLPPDPASPAHRDRGFRFVLRLGDRISGAGRLETMPWKTGAGTEVRLSAFPAPGREAEIREIAARIRGLLDGGALPEGIGVVSRFIDQGTAASIRRHFSRLGIPFSVEGASLPPGASFRRTRALLGLLTSGARTPAADWIEAAGNISGVGDPQLLETALRSTGLSLLRDIRDIDLETLCPKSDLEIPVVEGLDDRGKVRNAKISRKELEAARDAAASLLSALSSVPERGCPAGVFRWIRRILDLLPAFSEDSALLQYLDEMAAGLRDLPPVDREHIEAILPRLLDRILAETPGGDGSGVQVLTVMEARSRCFNHLFLMGMNRGVFPRRPDEDPILPENLRRAWSVILPELPLAGRSRLEESYLFAQLMAAAPEITLSWQSVDAEGNGTNPSAFIERLRIAGRLPPEFEVVPDVFPVVENPEKQRSPRPAIEAAAVAALGGHREDMLRAVETLEDRRISHLRKLLDELDPPDPRSDFGYFLGNTGVGKPEQLSATRLESYFQCPWQQFLKKELGLGPPPETLPAVIRLGGLLTGSTVHSVLEAIVSEAGAPVEISLDTLGGRSSVRVHWPEKKRLQQLLAVISRETALKRGLPALAAPLARAVLPLLEIAEKEDFSEGFRDILGAEIKGNFVIDIEGMGPVRIDFRADRVERLEDDLLLTDYKSGKSSSKTPLKQGKLQTALYACAAGGGSRGRYLYLQPESKYRALDIDISSEPGLRELCTLILRAWEEGLAMPKWNADGGLYFGPCRHCELKEACFRDDSTFRFRLQRALDAAADEHPLKAFLQYSGGTR